MSTHIERGARYSPNYDAGKGGYSSNKGIVATVFGATGFMGRYVVDRLASQGITTIIPYRGADTEPRHLKLMGDLGRVNPVPFDPRVVNSVRDVIRPSHLVINLIGKDYETKHWAGSMIKNYTYDQVHAEIPRMIAQVCAEQGTHQLIHMSSLAARPNALSKLDESKYKGEIAVRANFPDATILKPADVFGEEDRFLNTIASMARDMPRFAMVNNGKQLLQPVFVTDIADAVRALVQNPTAAGQTYNLAGPEVMSRKEITEFVFHIIGRPPQVLDLSPGLLQAFGKVAEQFPKPWFTSDQITQQIQDNIVPDKEENHLPMIMGQTPTKIEHSAYRNLHTYIMGGHFNLE